MKVIVDYPLYSVTESGEIYSYVSNRYLKPYDNGRGYLKIRLRNEHGIKAFYIHRLVAQAYIPNENNLDTVNHKDGNSLNNHFTNLEWCNIKENNKHAVSTGLRTRTSDKPVACIETGQLYTSASAAARAKNLKSSRGITEAIRYGGTAAGYHWRYADERDIFRG